MYVYKWKHFVVGPTCHNILIVYAFWKTQIPTKSILNPLIPLRAYIASDISRQFQNLNDIPVYTSRIETPKCVLNDQCSKIIMAQIYVYSLYIKIIVQ